jgi:hypothetical protein
VIEQRQRDRGHGWKGVGNAHQRVGCVRPHAHVGIVIEDVLKRMPTLIIVGNGVEAGNLALSDTDQLCGVIKLSRRSKYTLKKVVDVENAPHDSYSSSHACSEAVAMFRASISRCKQHDGNGSSYST